jgi:hypothetical protein
MKIPEPQKTIASIIDAHHESIRDLPRPHMGASMLGHPCDRWLWLSFRWAVKEKIDGRVLRLFRRGHLEEPQIVADLRAIGVDIRTTPKNMSVDFGRHVSGSIDAIAESGVPGAEKTRHVCEFKTHSKKSFDDLEKIGVEKSKPMHYVQMQAYMHGSKIDRALYVAVCKNDDRLYTERVRYSKDLATKAIERGHRIALSDDIPPPISTDPSWFECKFCPGHSFCHGTKTTKEVNCRTCAQSTAKEDNTWHCARHDDTIPVDAQHVGCECHVLHPDLVPWKRVESTTPYEAVYMIEEKPVRNGEPCAHVFSSKELLANPSMCAHADEYIDSLRDEFEGRIVG